VLFLLFLPLVAFEIVLSRLLTFTLIFISFIALVCFSEICQVANLLMVLFIIIH